MSGTYDDIIGLDRPVSNKRRRMTNHERAAQFAPFAALTGYGDAVCEKARLTSERIELDEYEKLALDAKLGELSATRAECDVTFIYFKPDARKAGGEYVSVTGAIKKLDAFERTVVMTDGVIIPMDDIISISAE